MTLFATIVTKTHRVPVSTVVKPGNAAHIARQLDVALISEGFKLSRELIEKLSTIHPAYVSVISAGVIDVLRDHIGSRVRHNTYFRDFPKNVPDTLEFWQRCIDDALLNPESRAKIEEQLRDGPVNLLDLPKYGSYQHSYESMVAAHDAFMPSVEDRVTVLHLGRDLHDEAVALYHSLAESTIPLSEGDRKIVAGLAEICLDDAQPQKTPVRETKALVNAVRASNKREIAVDTPTDVLRLAAALSEGDVTLETATKFKSFPRPIRRILLAALDKVVATNPEKLADVAKHAEPWKRLGERLHPHESDLAHAKEVFAVARRQKRVRSLAARVDMAFEYGDIAKAISILTTSPGMLFRNIDRILAHASSDDVDRLLSSVRDTGSKVSGRVILSVREHLQNRRNPGFGRIFANRKGTAWAMPESRPPLNSNLVQRLNVALDEEMLERLPEVGHLVVDRQAVGLAIPLCDKYKSDGFGIVPRGSMTSIAGDTISFFVYWKEKRERTDYDLSLMLLNRNFELDGHVSWTRLRGGEGEAVHSGDITSAPKGASEFVDVDLSRIRAPYLVPQVNVYAGEAFDETEECFFGIMDRSRAQMGKPFEPQTVRMKSDMRGKGKIALPLVIFRDLSGKWGVKWMHLYLKGAQFANRVERNHVSSGLIARTIFERDYLRIGYLAELLKIKAKSFTWYQDLYQGEQFKGPVTYIGLERPELVLPKGSSVFTLQNLPDLTGLTK